MKMHDLGEKLGASEAPAPTNPKSKKYYPSIHLDNMEALQGFPVGTKLDLHVVAVVNSQTKRENTERSNATTVLELHQAGLLRKPQTSGQMCPECASKGAGPYCIKCGAHMGKK